MPPTSPPPSASCRKRTRRGPRNEAAGLRLHLRRPPGRCLREPAASAPPHGAGRRGCRAQARHGRRGQAAGSEQHLRLLADRQARSLPEPGGLAAGFGRAAQNPGRVKTPLEKWSLDQLRLSMTVTGTATPLAMVEDPEHRGWPVRLGDFIGQNGGKVTGIHRDEVVITETITDHSTGRVYPQNVKLTG